MNNCEEQYYITKLYKIIFQLILDSFNLKKNFYMYTNIYVI